MTPTPSPSREQAERIVGELLLSKAELEADPSVARLAAFNEAVLKAIDAIAAALAERGARQGCIIDDKGVERKVLGTELGLTHDGYVVANEFVDVWCIHRGTGKPYRTIPYHAGMKPMYATEEAAQAAAAAGEGKVI
jgi:hypothetical protein